MTVTLWADSHIVISYESQPEDTHVQLCLDGNEKDTLMRALGGRAVIKIEVKP